MIASSTLTALSGCEIDRPAGHLVEITEGRPLDRSFPDRVTETLGVCLKIGPAHQVVVNGSVVVYPADAICVRAPGCIWSTPSTGDVGFLALDVDASLLPAGMVRGGMRFAGSADLPDLRVVARLLRRSRSSEQVGELVASLVIALARSGLTRADELRETASLQMSRRVREALESAPARSPSLEQLATDNRVSRFALLRQFKRDFGMTPHAFVLRLRIDRARAQLARGEDLAATALALGFADQSHFTRVFKRTVGITPGEYARRARRLTSVAPAISFKNLAERQRYNMVHGNSRVL